MINFDFTINFLYGKEFNPKIIDSELKAKQQFIFRYLVLNFFVLIKFTNPLIFL
jgi:hypothetical protein